MLPVYNGDKYLSRAIESVLEQTYENLELIISDNCSTDSTYEIAAEFAAKDKRIKLNKMPVNVGVVANYNYCVASSTGEYIGLFGHDDYFEVSCIEKFVRVFDEMANVVIVTGARNWIDKDDNVIRVARQFTDSRLVPGVEAIRSNMEALENWISAPVMFRSRLKGNGFNPNLILYGDLDFWCQMLRTGDLYYLDEILFNYRIHEGAETSTMVKDLVFARDMFRMIDRYGIYFRKEGETEEQSQARLGQKLLDWGDFVFNQRRYNLDHLLEPPAVDLSAPFTELQSARCDAHDYRRAACIVLKYAAKSQAETTQLRAQFQASLANSEAETRRLQSQVEELSKEIAGLRSSTSWKLTAPIRSALRLVMPKGN